MVLNTEPLGVLSSVENKFKVFYPSEHNNYEDLIVIIAIDDNNDIIILTVFEDSISKRIGKENL